jgi:hypothetical protein
MSNIQPNLDEVKKVLNENFGDAPQIVEAILACMAVISCLHFDDLPHCIGLIIVGPPSGGKTTALDVVDGLYFVYRTDKFSAKSFVSHYAAMSWRQLERIDLLPRIKGKAIIVPELAPILGARQEELLENISILTRVFDGRGLSTDSGTQGKREYVGDYRFCWLAATTPLPVRVWQVLGKLGARWLFMTVDGDRQVSREEMVSDMLGKDYKKKIESCRTVVHQFLNSNWLTYGGFGGIKFPVGDEEDKLLTSRLAWAAQDCSKWRGLIQPQDQQGFNPNLIENPRRLFATLYYLARGYALLDRRFLINADDVAAVEKIAYSSMPEDRRLIHQGLMRNATLSARDIANMFRIEEGGTKEKGISKPTAHRLMAELESLDVVVRVRGRGGDLIFLNRP